MLPPSALKSAFAQSCEAVCQLARNEVYSVGFLSKGLTDGQREEGLLSERRTGSCPQERRQLLSTFFPRLRRATGHFSGLRLQFLEGVCYFLMRQMNVRNSGNIGGLFVGRWEGAGLCYLESSLNVHHLVAKVEVAPW